MLAIIPPTNVSQLLILLMHFCAELLPFNPVVMIPCFIFSVLKKVKHRVVEAMSSGTADALGLSRAILCNGEW